MTWTRTTKFDRDCATVADRHYSRRTVGSNQFMPPGQTVVLKTSGAIWGWWRPHPDAGFEALNGMDGWTCTIFRNESSGVRSSQLVLDAESALVDAGYGCGPDGMLTYVWDGKIKSSNPGYCFQCAGWKRIDRSADGRKTLLWKSFAFAGQRLRRPDEPGAQSNGNGNGKGH
jgi:hypothetical protein